MKGIVGYIRNHEYRIILIFTIMMSFFFIIVAISFYNISAMIREDMQRSLIYRTAKNADLTREGIDNFKHIIEGIALRKSIRSMNWEKQKSFFMSESERQEIQWFQVADLNGKAQSTEGFIRFISDNDYFNKAKNGLTVITDPLKNKENSKKYIICSTPIYDDSEHIISVLNAAVNPQSLFRMIENQRVGRTGYAFITNRRGKVITGSQNESRMDQDYFLSDIFKNLNKQKQRAIIDRICGGEVGYYYFYDKNVQKLIVFAPILNTEWSLAMIAPTKEIFYEIDGIKARFLILGIVLLAVSTSFTVILYQYIVQSKKLFSIQQKADEQEKQLIESMELDKLKTEFFANISHELRTPINVILSTIQLIYLNTQKNLTSVTDPVNKHLHIMRQNSLRLIRLINNLIDTTKIDAGFYKITLENHNVVSIVEDITLSVANYVKGKNLELVFDTEVEEKILACDADKIERIMLNLLSNAVKFTDQGGSIFVNMYDKADSIVISVRDTGIGIPSDKIDLLFNRFRQVDKSLTRNHEGSGIGLSLVKSLVEMHGGKVSVSSTYTKGSNFTIELPVQTLPESSEEKTSYTYEQNNHVQRIHVEFSDIYSIS